VIVVDIKKIFLKTYLATRKLAKYAANFLAYSFIQCLATNVTRHLKFLLVLPSNL
jgi:hypothetical protein